MTIGSVIPHALPLSAAPSRRPRAASPPPAAPTPRQDRVGHFLADVRASALEQTRYVSATWIGELTGMAIGGSVMGPLGLALGNLYIVTGGTALLGGLGALAGYAAEKHHLGQKIAGALGLHHRAQAEIGAGAALAAGAVRATPNIVYPAIANATAAERAVIMKALEAMPLSDVSSVQQIGVVNGLEKLGASGLTQPLYFGNHILLGHESMADAAFGYTTTIHEAGHTLDFTRGFGPIGSLSTFGPFGKGPYWFDPDIDVPGQPPYAATNRFEDFAQTHMAYHVHPEEMKSLSPDKFAAMDKLHQPGPVDRLLDRSGVRQVGRTLGEATEKIPYLRTALDLGAAIVGPAVVHSGAAHLEKAIAAHDDVQRFQGKMRLAAGFAYLFKTAAPLGLAASVAQYVYSKQLQHGTITVEQANRRADAFLALSLGPIGTSGMAALQTLEKEGIAPLDAPTPAVPKNAPGVISSLAGALVGSYAGQVAGTLLGTAVGGVGGALAGAWWGKVGGALLGLGAVSAVRALKARHNGVAPSGGLTGRDKLHLTAVLGGAAVGGTLGTVGGGWAGAALGGALGNAVGGPVGAGIGSLLGRVAGVVGASYGGAKLGAAAGRHVAPDEGT